jgi:DNA-binding NarL/FixJ family response regulator
LREKRRSLLSLRLAAATYNRLVGEPSEPPISRLTEIERQVLGLLAEGADERTIASKLVISQDEVRTHVRRILTKLGVHSRLEAAARWVTFDYEPRPAQRPTRVLIVDDHDLFAEAIKSALSYTVIDVAAVVGTGREAVAYAVEHRPDVVLLDLALPDMSGLAAGRMILESWPDAKLVALTALEDPRAIWRAITIGFRGHVGKDTPVRTFIGCIQGVAAGARVFPDLLVSEDLRHRSGTSIGSEGSAMFERFTDRARRVVVLAQEEARMLNHIYIGTEHILLGLVHEGDGVAARALESLNISLEASRQQVEQLIGRGQAAPTGHIPFTPRAKKVLELAFREAMQLGHDYIGTEHILLGLIREGEGVGAEVLQRLGAELNRVRQTVIQLLSGYAAGKGVPEALESALEAGTLSSPRCPSCNRLLDDNLRYRTMLAAPADEDQDPVSVRIFFCGRCGAILSSLRGDAEVPLPTEPGESFDVEEN